jgi:hypothetical protein
MLDQAKGNIFLLAHIAAGVLNYSTHRDRNLARPSIESKHHSSSSSQADYNSIPKTSESLNA